MTTHHIGKNFSFSAVSNLIRNAFEKAQLGDTQTTFSAPTKNVELNNRIIALCMELTAELKGRTTIVNDGNSNNTYTIEPPST